MEFEEVLGHLLENYAGLGLEAKKANREIIAKYKNHEFKVLEDDIRIYAEQEEILSSLDVGPVECSVNGCNYFEQIIEFIEPYRLVPSFHRIAEEILFGTKKEGEVYVVVGRATDLFCNKFRFDKIYFGVCLERMRRTYLRGRTKEDETRNEKDIRNFMYRPLTIRVHNIGAPSKEAAAKRASNAIDACLFELSYLKGLTLGLVEQWPRRERRPRPFRFHEPIHANELPFPKVKYRPEIIRFYQRGASTRDPIIKFLSFYQIVEYFFIPVSDEQLYATLSHRINDPLFSANPRYLNKLVQDVLDHRRITDETAMLKSVLEKYVEIDEAIAFIEAYETHMGENLYTKRKQIFGQDIPDVKLQIGHFFGNISKRIKAIRNAIVHSSDRYEQRERFIPLTARAEDTVRKEIPLMKFLAERVIISSAAS